MYVFLLILTFLGCGNSSSSTDPSMNEMPLNEAGNDYTNAYDVLDSAAKSDGFDTDNPSKYSDVFENWLNFPLIYINIYQDMLDNATFNPTDSRWEAEIDNPFGNDPQKVTVYGKYKGEVFRVAGPGDPQNMGLFIYPDGGISLYTEIDSFYIKMEIYREDGYYYGFLRFNEGLISKILKFKFEDQTPCEDFKMYYGDYEGGSSIGEYELIRNRSGSAEDWYTDETNLDKTFSIIWDGTNFNYYFHINIT